MILLAGSTRRLKQQSRRCLAGMVVVLFLLSSQGSAGVEAPTGMLLRVTKTAEAQTRTLREWSRSEMEKEIPGFSLREPDVKSDFKGESTSIRNGPSVLWKGVRLRDLLDKTWGELAPEQKALVDLLVLKGNGGTQALVPRALAVKYPMMLAYQKAGGPLEKLVSIPPLRTHPQMAKEGVPLEVLVLPHVEEVELTNYRARFPKAFLTRRTDPAALRGEKLFVQSCLSCHATGRGPEMKVISEESRLARLVEVGHPAVLSGPVLDAKERRSLKNYLEEFRAENQATAVLTK